MHKKIFAAAALMALALGVCGAALQETKSGTDKPAKQTQEKAKKAKTAAAPAAKKKPAEKAEKTDMADKKGGDAEIKAVLDAQKAAWNAKKLDGFMAYYWKSKDLTFQAGEKVVRGWGAVGNRYKKNYPVDKMGTLDFKDIEVRLLGKNFAYVLGRWSVAQGADTKGGVFTLILRRTAKGWRIIHDHTQ
jgi:ketosteroid isomerase-like protein